MKWNHDEKLTETQRTLKWGLHCEVDMETNEDIKAVLLSILKDLEAEDEARKEALAELAGV